MSKESFTDGSWEFDLGQSLTSGSMKQLTDGLTQHIGDVIIGAIDKDFFHLTWSGSSLFVTGSFDHDPIAECKFEIEDIVDHCFNWDMKPEADGRFCLEIAEKFEAQAARLREGVRVASIKE